MTIATLQSVTTPVGATRVRAAVILLKKWGILTCMSLCQDCNNDDGTSCVGIVMMMMAQVVSGL